MCRKLDSKVAIVTGAGRGIGRGIALVFAREGAKVVIAEMNADTAHAVAQEIRAEGGEALAIVCDITDAQQVKQMVERAVERFGPIDILINNAIRIPPALPLEEADDGWWAMCLDTGPKATWYCCKAVLPYMKNRGGKIVNFGSRAGIYGLEGLGSYSTAKEAIRGFTRTAAREWGQYNINVNVIAPTAGSALKLEWAKANPEQEKALMSQQTIKRWGDPEKDIAPLVVFLSSDDASFITGQTIQVNGMVSC